MNSHRLQSPKRRHFRAPVFLLLLVSAVLSSCQTEIQSRSVDSSNDPRDQLRSDSRLIKAGPVTAYPVDKNRVLLFLASLPILSGQIDTTLLASEGYADWRTAAIPRIRAVQGIKIRFTTEIVSGQSDIQSGMLFLPVFPAGQSRSLSWIIHTKGTELRRDQVPSNNSGAETPLAASYAALGYAVWMPDYAGMGDSPGVHPYCVPESLGNSARDGLEAARDYLTWMYGTGTDSAPHYQETGRIYLVGYSEGGLAAMAGAKAILERPLPGLALETVFAMGAPLNLTTGTETIVRQGGILGHPEYQIWLAMGWARAHPDAVKLEEILTDRILQEAVPLFDGSRDSGQLLDAIGKILQRPTNQILLSDIFRQSYIEQLQTAPGSAALFTLETEHRLDRWLPPPNLPIILAASPHDTVVNPSNSQSARDWVKQQEPASRLEYITLGSKNHIRAGGEALLLAILRIDHHELEVLNESQLETDR